MKARHLIEGAVYPPDVLRVLFDALDDAWSVVAPDVSTRPVAIEAARLSLATILLSLAKQHPIDRASLTSAAVDAFRLKHPMGRRSA